MVHNGDAMRRGLADRTRVLLAVLLCAAVIGGIGWKFNQNFGYNAAARTELRDLYGRLRLGDSPQRVRQLMAASEYTHLTLRTGSNPAPRKDLWNVGTPTEFGAGNWVLFMEFDQNTKIAALLLRTADSVYERPRERDNVPADRVRAGWKTAYAARWRD